MKHPKCKTCGKEHALGGCPEFRSKSKPEDRRGIIAIDSFEDVKPEPVRPEPEKIIVGVDPGSKDFGAKVIGRVMEDGRIEILSLTHSKAQFNKAEYQRQYMADQRTIKRLGLNCTVSQFRAGKYGENK